MDHWDPDSMPGPLFRKSDLQSQAQLSEVDFQTKPRRPDDFNAKRIQAAYYAMIELIDLNVGRLVETLEKTGQLDDTVIIFTSDHGEALGDHGLVQKGCRFYEGLVRVPLIIHWPDRFLRNVQSDALVELRDLAPTVLALAGLDVPERMQARSLLPILTGTADANQHRSHVRSEYFHVLPPTDRNNFEGTYATMIRDDRYKLVVYHGHETGELFDLREDPGEFTNLWDDPSHRHVRFRLMKQNLDDLAHAVDTGPEQTGGF
jgi:arylsulfatase A-like enzyme